MRLRILKLGWEFPPHNYGGLGVACEGIVKGLTAHGHNVLLVLPRAQKNDIDHCNIVSTDQEPMTYSSDIEIFLHPYVTPGQYMQVHHRDSRSVHAHLYGEYIFAEIERYARAVARIALQEQFDVIHAHDWMSFKAGVLAKELSGASLIVHVHATEFDRTGGNGINQRVYDIERWGMHAADKIIAVSRLTKDTIVKQYDICPDKVTVIYNAINHGNAEWEQTENLFDGNNKIVLFLGRLTLQKGPDYFISVAQKILEHRSDVCFVISGSGDMEHRLMEQVASQGLAEKILFTGWLSGVDVARAYRMADVYVMPSVSEPFGLTALEAMQCGVPVVMSKQSGVSEVIAHALKVDFWDINEMANKVIAVLDYDELRYALGVQGNAEVRKFNWHDVADQCVALYHDCLSSDK